MRSSSIIHKCTNIIISVIPWELQIKFSNSVNHTSFLVIILGSRIYRLCNGLYVTETPDRTNSIEYSINGRVVRTSTRGTANPRNSSKVVRVSGKLQRNIQGCFVYFPGETCALCLPLE